jgi:hypothetical protein
VYMRILALIALLFLLSSPSRAATCTPSGDTPPPSCTNTVSPTDTTAVFDFTNSGNGYLTLQFNTVLTTFTLTAMYSNTIDPFDPNEFPAGTVCVPYNTNIGGQCVQYNFSGNAGGPNGVPVQHVDYEGLITIILSYDTDYSVRVPAFGHAPGDVTTFTEDMLTFYSTSCGTACHSDPTMGGTPPGLSSIAALDEPFVTATTFCSLTITPTTVGNGQQPQFEVDLMIVSASSACNTGPGIRDKTATLSVSTTDPVTGAVSFPTLKNVQGNKFHWDGQNLVNEYDFSTDGLVSGQHYLVSVRSDNFGPQSISFIAP